MDEKELDYEVEPVAEEPVTEPGAYEPPMFVYTPPVQPQPTVPQYETPMQEPPVFAAPPEPKAEGKKPSFVAMVLLLVAVAVIAGVGGSFLGMAIEKLRSDENVAMQAPVKDPMEGMMPTRDNATQNTEAPAQDKPYEVGTHALPEELTANDAGKSLTPAQVYELTVNSVVGIQTEVTMNAFGQEAVAASAGSGFILSEDGYIITNSHVIADANKITVELFNGDSFPAEVVGSDSSFDIAVLKIQANGLPAVGVGDSDKLKVGEEVVAIGNPLGELTFTMTNGILSALNREVNTDGNPQNMLQTNAAINSGNSGGPLFDMDGNVIGVTTAKYSGSTASGTLIEGLGFAIPINDALKVAYDLVEYGYVKDQAYLGVTVRTLDSQTASFYGLPVGPRVESVNPGSCAETAGIQVGDIIIACNGVKVENNPELLAQLKKHKAGETITITLFRAGSELEVTVVLDEKPSQEVIDATLTEQQQDSQETFEEVPDDYYYQYPDGFFD